jgi:peptide deformylase
MKGKVLEVARMGNPILETKCDSISDPTAPEIKQLIQDMLLTIKHRKCLGLSAPQVFYPLRLVIYHIPKKVEDPERYEITPQYDPDGVPYKILINPEITPLSDELSEGWEGCQSVPGLMGLVQRNNLIKLEALDENGKPLEMIARGFHARLLQHECDHLDGVLFPHRLKDVNMFGYYQEVIQYLKR